MAENQLSKQVLAVLMACCACNVMAAESLEIPANYDSISLLDPDAIKFASVCAPEIEERDIVNAIDSSKRKQGVVSLHTKKRSETMLLFVGNSIICQALSPARHPIIPLSEFDGTVNFSGMSGEQKITFYTDISRQLADKGMASVLVVNEAGKSVNVIFVTRWGPMSLQYSVVPHGGGKVDGVYNTTYNVVGGYNVFGRSFAGKLNQNTKILGLADTVK